MEKKMCGFEGCDRCAVSKGYCDMHYRRLIKRGSPDSRGSRNVELGDAAERFHKKYIVQEDGCWIWTAGTRPNSKGVLYGRHFSDEQKSVGAHRFSYQLHIGEIPKGMYVCHKCDTPLCVNPDHLFIGKHLDNMADMVQKNRSYRGRGENKIGVSKITNKQAEEIRQSQLSQSTLGRMYGLSQTSVGRIKRGECY